MKKSASANFWVGPLTIEHQFEDRDIMLSFVDVNDYMKALKQPRMWRPMLYRILSHHKIVEISDQFRPNIVSLQDGTNPVFFIHGWKIREGQIITTSTLPHELESVQCVIKLSSSYFAGSKGFKTETHFYEHLAQHQPALANVTPRMLAKGVLAELYEQHSGDGNNTLGESEEPHHPHYTPYPHFSYDQVWPWPYIVLTYITALPVIRVYDKLTREDMTRTCAFLKEWMPQLHQLAPTGTRTWHEFEHFVAKQRRSCRTRHQDWQLLSPNLIAELDSYLPRDARELFKHARDQSPVYLHGDLSDEQVLGVLVDNNEHVINIDPRGAWPEGVKWKPVSLIDFGDTLIGDTAYELVAIHLALFRCDKQLLGEFVKQFPAGYFGPLATLAYRCMCYTLIHVQDAIRTVWMTHPEWCPVPYPTPHMRGVELRDQDSSERQLRDGVVPPRREFSSLKELEQLLWGVEEWLH